MKRLLIIPAVAALALASPLARAGRLPGPGSTETVVGGYETDTYSVFFEGGEMVLIRVSGDGDSDLDLFVYDDCGRLVASDTDSTDQCLVVFTPRRTARFRIEVRNLGHRANLYTLETN